MIRNTLLCLPRRNVFLEHFAKQTFYRCSTVNSDKENTDGYISRRALKRHKILSDLSKKQIDTEYDEKDLQVPSEKVGNLLDQMMSDEKTEQIDLELFSSDIIDAQKVEEKHQEKIKRPKVDPETTSFALFPGQGSQFVGMGKELLQFPGVQAIYDQASEILRYDLLKLCLYGPKSELDKTVYCQPAVFVTSIAAIERLKEENIQGIENTVGTAGFSVGEYAALVFAGILSFEDALKVVKVRAEAMQRASEETPSGMMTVFSFWGTKLPLAMEAARQHCLDHHGIQDPVCSVANYLFPEVKVIAGHEQALEFIQKNHKDFGIRKCKRVPVSGAFHTPLMLSAKKPVMDALKTVQIHPYRIPVYSNVEFKKFRLEPKNFYQLLTKQIVKPVKWEQIMTELYSRDRKQASFPITYECGPGKQLGMFLQKMNNRAFANYVKIEV